MTSESAASPRTEPIIRGYCERHERYESWHRGSDDHREFDYPWDAATAIDRLVERWRVGYLLRRGLASGPNPLRRYAQHDWSCEALRLSDSGLHPCTCGFAQALAQEAPAPDAGNRDRNHYDWFMPENPTAAVDEYLDDFEAKCREGLTDPFMHDMSQAVLPLIEAYRQSRAARLSAGGATKPKGDTE